jgi:glutamate N-acetyltransferase/amino-acid N-acetyltransferase
MGSFVSPFVPERYPFLPPLKGVGMATCAAGIKKPGHQDVLLMIFPADTQCAGVFTRSLCPSAAVDWCRDVLQTGTMPRALLINSGNANAFTGQKGKAAVKRSAQSVANTLGLEPQDVMLASTGVIGEPLDAGKFDLVMDGLVQKAREHETDTTQDHWHQAARAIMTTDTFPKMATASGEIGKTPVVINAIAKGAGMIAPDMATMLAFIVTDAAIDRQVLQHMLAELTPVTFNAISVDGDTSTSDTLLCFATGTAGHAPVLTEDDPRLAAFKALLHQVMLDLAQQIVKDGEGLTKFITLQVKGAVSDHSAKIIAQSIANSPLVKTAFAGEDANWGRVIMAVGKAGQPAERDRLSIWFDDVCVAREGERNPGYNEAETTKIMQQQDITLTVDLGLGEGAFTFWTCDMTHDYISINADYRS